MRLSGLGIQQRFLRAFEFRYTQLFPDLLADLRDVDDLDLSRIQLGLVCVNSDINF